MRKRLPSSRVLGSRAPGLRSALRIARTIWVASCSRMGTWLRCEIQSRMREPSYRHRRSIFRNYLGGRNGAKNNSELGRVPDNNLMTHRRFRALGRLPYLGLLLSFASAFCFSACPEMDGEPHFHKIYESESARVFTLELGRLESTASCPQHAYFYVVTSETETTDTPAGRVGWSHRWNSGEARFVAEPKPHEIRNNMAIAHRAIFVEILSKLE